MFPSLVLGQVEAVYPETFEVGCVFANLSSLHSIRVQVSADESGPYTGDFRLPKIGEFGLIVMFMDDANTAVWLKGVSSGVWNIKPFEILKDDPTARVQNHRDGSHNVHYTNGDRETRLPDGTLLRVTHSKDGSKSNAKGRAKVTKMQRSKDKNPATNARDPEREVYEPPVLPPADLHIKHASGTEATLSADGSVFVKTAKGHRVEVDDATEKVRNKDGKVTAKPDETAQRKTSGVRVVTEKGIKLTLNDDPVKGIDRYARLELPTGTKAELMTGGGKEHVRLQTKSGSVIEAQDSPKKFITARVAGREMTLDATGMKNVMKSGGQVIEQGVGKTRVTDPVLVEISAPVTKTNQITMLGGGGPPVARLGDQVIAQGVGNLGIPVIVVGNIVSGATKTFAG